MGVPRASCEEPSALSVYTGWEGQPGFAGSGFSRVLRSSPLPGTLAPRESAAAFLHELVNNPRLQAVLPLSNPNLSCLWAAQRSGAGCHLCWPWGGPSLSCPLLGT